MRYRPGEEDLMVRLFDAQLIDELKLRDKSSNLERALLVEIRDIAHNQVVAVESHGVAPIDQSPEVFVMTDQLVKH
jgi:hypothetical protein